MLKKNYIPYIKLQNNYILPFPLSSKINLGTYVRFVNLPQCNGEAVGKVTVHGLLTKPKVKDCGIIVYQINIHYICLLKKNQYFGNINYKLNTFQCILPPSPSPGIWIKNKDIDKTGVIMIWI